MDLKVLYITYYKRHNGVLQVQDIQRTGDTYISSLNKDQDMITKDY